MGRHAANLSIFAFGEHEFQPRSRDRLAKSHRRIALPQARRWLNAAHATGQGHEIGVAHPAPQLLYGCVGRLALDLHPVGFWQLVLGLGNARLQLAIVGEQQQAFAVGIQPPGDIDAGHRNQAFQPLPAPFVGKLAEVAVGLVEEEYSGHWKSTNHGAHSEHGKNPRQISRRVRRARRG